MARADGRLTIKREQFVREYLVDKNATAAAIRSGYSARSAKKIGHELLQQPTVRALVRRLIDEQATRTLISADQVLLDINRIADKADVDGEYNAAIRGKELLGKHFKLFTEKHEHGGLGGGPVLLEITDREADL
jgi:phage terminase small subunit